MDNIEKIREGLRDRPVGTIDRHRFFIVTIPLVVTEKGLCLMFEVRSSKLKHQPGDICFPGGMIAVSYTHLDVYKRQAYTRRIRGERFLVFPQRQHILVCRQDL